MYAEECIDLYVEQHVYLYALYAEQSVKSVINSVALTPPQFMGHKHFISLGDIKHTVDTKLTKYTQLHYLTVQYQQRYIFREQINIDPTNASSGRLTKRYVIYFLFIRPRFSLIVGSVCA